MKRKKLSSKKKIDKIIISYNRKGKLSEKELESLENWKILEKLNQDMERMKLFMMGGYPSYKLYDTITPYYQLIAYLFLFMSIFLLAVSIGGHFFINFQQWSGYIVPGFASLLFSFVLFYFIKLVKK